MTSEARFALALTQVPGIGPVIAKALISAFGRAEAVFHSAPRELEEIDGIGRQLSAAISGFSGWDAVDRVLRRSEQHRMQILTLGQTDYPSSLGEIPDPPTCLFTRGRMIESDALSMAIVGSRSASRDGMRAAAQLAEGLASRGITIISGMARGVDASAHHAAIRSGGRTLAVLGCGLDVVYPAENLRLYKSIPDCGAILTEFPPGTKPDAGNFPIRNRIISGLSKGIVVIEASEKSGSLITAHRALDQGREVFAVPGSIFTKGAKGTNSLIQQGAKLVQGIDDILEELFPERLERGHPQAAGPSRAASLTDSEAKVFAGLDQEARHMDEIIQSASLPSSKVSEALLQLELKDLVVQLPGKLFARKG